MAHEDLRWSCPAIPLMMRRAGEEDGDGRKVSMRVKMVIRMRMALLFIKLTCQGLF